MRYFTVFWDKSSGIHAGWLIIPWTLRLKGPPSTRDFSYFAGSNWLLGVWGALLRRYWPGQVILYLLRMSLDLCVAPYRKMAWCHTLDQIHTDTNCNWCPWNGPQRFGKGEWKSWKSVGESRLSKLHYCWDRPEYWEESRRPEETCCNSDSSEKLTANVSLKNSLGV